MSAAAIVELMVRYGLVMLFLPFSALDKSVGFEGAVKQAQEVCASRRLAALVLTCGLAIEVFMSLGVVTGIADRLCALVIAGYCAATAGLFKRFWAQGDFWAAGESKGRTLFWDFLKNLSLGAGFLLILVGTNGSGLRPFLAHPLASSHPYSTAQEPR
ncbi:MAG: DoxX family membrane protein [Steroidobacteraceae bacterium]